MSTSTDNHFDSIMFDMDGTLWDAVTSYCTVWNATIRQCCPDVPEVTYDRLVKMMGRPLDIIFNEIIGTAAPYGRFMDCLHENEVRIMPVMGGKLYPGVFDTIRELSTRFRLFMVSNCTELGLPVFLNYTRLKPFFTDAISFGDNGQEKDYNIRLLADKYSLRKPLYVGDTAGDGHSAHAAGVEFAWASYGFGRDVADYEMKITSITDLLSMCRAMDK